MEEHILHILIVEDENSHSELIRRAFLSRNSRIQLTIVETLADARASLAGPHQPDMVITDLLLPDGKGIELLPAGGDPPFPLIVMTNYGDEHVAVEAIKAGALDYVAKSIETLNDMPHLVERAMREWDHIIEKKRTEAALKESETKYRDTFENCGIAFAIIEGNTIISMVNREYEKLSGYTREEIDGIKSWKEFIACEDDLKRITGYHNLRTTDPGNVPRSYEFDLIGRAGCIKTVVATVTILPGTEQRVVTLVDITKRKRAEEEKEKLLEQLRQSQKLEALGLLAGGIAHDFNNILTAIIGYANLMKRKTRDDGTFLNNLDQILSASEKAASLTSSLLSFSRKQPVDLKPTNLNEVIRKVERFLVRIIGEDIETHIINSPEDIYIMADTGQLEQVLINLSANARDAMPRGGQLIIKTERIKLDDEFIKMHGYGTNGLHTLISVSDTGIGMDEVTRNRIFEPFFTTKEVGKGTGLGLSIVFGIVKQHNGYISCCSEPDRGTCFKIYLPMIEKQGIVLPQRTEQADPTGAGQTILVAEDDDSIRDIIHHLLEEYGYNVIEAINGEDAVTVFRENRDRIDLLFFDLIMPRMNGKEAYEMINSIKPGIKVIFTSGYPLDFALTHGNLTKEANFLSKPVQPSTLLKKIWSVLNDSDQD